jgi:hypothetical protein
MAQTVIGLKKFTKYMDDVVKRQIPFATSQALNTAAFGAQGFVKRDIPSKFIMRKTWIQKGILVTKALKTRLTAFVFSRDYFMLDQEQGGVRTAGKHRIAVPDEIRKNPRTKISEARKPKNILKKPHIFIINNLIVQRKGGKKIRRKGSGASFEKKYKILYKLTRRAMIKPRFDMRGTVDRAVIRIFPGAFNKQLLKALGFRTVGGK